MENIFSPARFGNLINKHFREHLRTYLMISIVFGGGVLLLFMFLISASNRPLTLEDQFAIWGVSLMVGIFVFTANVFAPYNHSRSAFPATTLPASIFEKYLLHWLVSFAGFTFFALAAYHLSQSIIIGYLRANGLETEQFFAWNGTEASPPSNRILLVYILLHSVAFLGAVSFRKNTVLLTALVAFSTVALYVYINHLLTQAVLNGDGSLLPFSHVNVLTVDGWASINRPNNELWATISLSTLILLLWICAYFKLKERQV